LCSLKMCHRNTKAVNVFYDVGHKINKIVTLFCVSVS